MVLYNILIRIDPGLPEDMHAEDMIDITANRLRINTEDIIKMERVK